MSAKPSVIATWATGGPITTPSAGKKTAGWTPAERAAAQYFNWLHNTAGLWQQYLSDGAMSGAFTFDSTIDCTTGYRGAAGAAALFPSGLSATALKFTNPVSTLIPNTLAFEVGGTLHSKSVNGMIYTTSADPVYWPLLGLRVGDVITQVLHDFAKNTTGGGDTVTYDIVRFPGTSAEVSVTGGASTQGGSPGAVALAKTGTWTVVSGNTYFWKIIPANSITGAADRSYDLTLTFTRP